VAVVDYTAIVGNHLEAGRALHSVVVVRQLHLQPKARLHPKYSTIDATSGTELDQHLPNPSEVRVKGLEEVSARVAC